MPTFYEPGLNDFEKKYMWVTYGENCPLCEAMRGRVYKLDVFASTGFYPGFHRNCNCVLRRVPDDTEESPMDLFPEYINQNLGLVGSLFHTGTWKPYNLFILDEFMRATPDGGTINDAVSAFKAGTVTDGSILPYPKWRGLLKSLGFYGWIQQLQDPHARLQVYVNMFEGIDGDFSSGWSLMPKQPPPLRPVLPSQSYYYPHVPVGDIYP